MGIPIAGLATNIVSLVILLFMNLLFAATV